MSIYHEKGDLFKSTAEAIVNTVNCVGVMGKGVALAFKNRSPKNYTAYKKLCLAKELRPGKVFIFDSAGGLFGEPSKAQRYIINFPTKDHWRSKSKLSYIEDGLDDFIFQLQKYNIQSVALPPLGCGNGGLNWYEVKVLLEEKLSPVAGIDFYIYDPKDEISVPEHESIPMSRMTRERSILVKIINEFEPYFGGYLTRISLQKIVYFLQSMGLNYGVNFSRNTHGPYSDSLHKAFKSMDRQGFIVNYIGDVPRIQASAGALVEANLFLDNNENEQDSNYIQKLSLLVQGYESPFGMELLSSVHYLVEYESLTDTDDVVQAINDWNEHKSNQFESDAIKLAYKRLSDDGFINH